MEITDEQVVLNVLNGATDDYALLVRKYERVIFNLMFRYTGCTMESADLSQEIFMQCFTKLPSLKSDKNYFSWLYTIALNKGRDWVRTQGRKACRKHAQAQDVYRFSPEIYTQTPSTQEQKMQLRQEQQRVETALMTLPPDKREIMILRFKHELSIREIAEIFSITQSAVKMRISRCLDQLHEIMTNMADSE